MKIRFSPGLRHLSDLQIVNKTEVMSLVADYSDSSDSEEETSSNSSKSGTEESCPPAEKQQTKLPSAAVALANVAAKKTGEVFSNPFLEAELIKTASLERHVKMVKNDTHEQLKNGRKICWNYRKGRCRFGTTCQYAHDSDLSVNESVQEPKVETPQPRVVGATTSTGVAGKKRQRPGLGDAVVPSKRVMTSYQKQNTGTQRHTN